MSVGLAMNSFAMEQTASPKIFPYMENENVRVFLGKVTNNSSFTIIIKELSQTINAKDSAELNIKLGALGNFTFGKHFSIGNANAEYPYLNLLILCNVKLRQLLAQFTLHKISPLPHMLADPITVIDLSKITKPTDIYFDLVIDGDKLENSRIISRVEARPVPTLKELSIKAIAEKIKAGNLTLEQAKMKVPTDLHEALEKYVKENQ